MASIRKGKRGYRAEVCVNRKRESGTFDTLAKARAWAIRREQELSQPPDQYEGRTMRDLLHRYLTEVVPAKRGAKKEAIRLRAFAAERIADVQLSDLSPAHLAEWRDARLQEVMPSSVRREMVMLGSAIETARREWGWIQSNPMREVKKPPDSRPRDRLITDDEIQRLAWALGWDHGEPVTQTRHRVAVAFLFAIETGMRAGEICGLRKSDIDGRVARLPMTKNGTSRSVPLSLAALDLIGALDEDLFNMTTETLSTVFRKARLSAGIDDITFHDSRHLAITRLARKFNPLELARIVGHKNLNQLMTYYNEAPEELAKKLD